MLHEKKINELERKKAMLNVQIANLYEQIKNLERIWQEQKQTNKKVK
jgi:prefoldin subunit 5